MNLLTFILCSEIFIKHSWGRVLLKGQCQEVFGFRVDWFMQNQKQKISRHCPFKRLFYRRIWRELAAMPVQRGGVQPWAGPLVAGLRHVRPPQRCRGRGTQRPSLQVQYNWFFCFVGLTLVTYWCIFERFSDQTGKPFSHQSEKVILEH